MIEIEIDGKKLQAEPNQMVIQVADAAGIYIPRFCYHKHLSIAANCRMCLVEVEKAPKTLPACATPVMPNMKVFTRSPKAIASQKAVMEFLLINHPLDCPICDQGGECELQDLSIGFGSDDSRYKEGKRAVADQNLGPLIETEMTRCIQCTRCVRFGDEIAGMRELGAVNRGEHLEIRVFLENAIQSEVSGNVIDLCPVGALTSKPFRFTARAWELDQHSSISPHDCIGSNIYVHTRWGKVMRVVPREHDSLNQTWISDRDRFSYQGVYHADRLGKPMLRKNNVLVEVEWEEVLEKAVLTFKEKLSQYGSDEVGALASANSTLEELYLFQKILRQLGVNNIDHRLRQTNFQDQEDFPLFPGLNMSIADLEKSDVILLIGSNIQKEQPIASLRVRQAFLKGAKILSVNMVDYQFPFSLSEKAVVSPANFTVTLAKIAKVLLENTNVNISTEWKNYLSEIKSTKHEKQIAQQLLSGKKVVILVGALAINHDEASEIRKLVKLISRLCNSHLGFLTEGSNTAGAWLTGILPHRTLGGVPEQKSSLNVREMLVDPRKIYVLLNIEPDFDSWNANIFEHALKKADFVVALSSFKSPMLEKYADVILPIGTFSETSGTFVNTSGFWQSFNGAALPFEGSRPGWKVLRVLGNLFDLEGFDYLTSDDVREECKEAIDALTVHFPTELSFDNTHFKNQPSTHLSRIGEIPIYAGDALVRRASALQEIQSTLEGELNAVRINTKTAKELNLKDGMLVNVKQQMNFLQLPLVIDDRLPDQSALIYGGIEATKNLGDLFGEIMLESASSNA